MLYKLKRIKLVRVMEVFFIEKIRSFLGYIFSLFVRYPILVKPFKIFRLFSPSLFDRCANIGRREFDGVKTVNFVSKTEFPEDHIRMTSNLNFKHSTIYIYVDHTCLFNKNTGVQQVVRQTIVNLLLLGNTVIPLKWDNVNCCFHTISTSELNTLLLFCELNEKYIKRLQLQATSKPLTDVPVSNHRHIFYVPEVPYINYHGRDLTRAIVDQAKCFNFLTAFIFYDATPLYRKELAHAKSVHEGYMNALAEADFIFPISRFSQQQLSSYYKEINKNFSQNTHIQTLHLACSFLKIKNVPRTNLPNQPFILCVGSISEHKNQITLINAFKKFKQDNPTNNLVLLLLGNYDESIRESIESAIDLNDEIIVMTNVDNDTIVAAYTYCEFTIFPSQMEGFGLPIIESLYFDKPCITANFGAMAEVATDIGCLLVNTLCEDKLSNAIADLALNDSLMLSKKQQATQRYIENWFDYGKKLVQELILHRPNEIKLFTEEENAKKRLFFLGMHKILTKTELVRLRELGYEVFNPPYISDIVDQSAETNWDAEQVTSLPPNIFAELSQTKFFYVDELSKNIENILNAYFDAVIVTISPTWLAPILRQYNGKIIYRVYGQVHDIKDEFNRMKLKPYVDSNPHFYFTPHANEAVENEPEWLRKNEHIVPYCLMDDVFGYANSWVGPEQNNGEVIIGCPNIANPWYQAHYNLLKQHYIDKFYKIYGVQTSKIDDPAVVGTLQRRNFLKRFMHSACYLYTYPDHRVCYLPPIEAMVIGLPVIFPEGCLLDKYFGIQHSAGRFRDHDHAKKLVTEIRNNNTDLIESIIDRQSEIIKRYKPSSVWDKFDEFCINHI